MTNSISLRCLNTLTSLPENCLENLTSHFENLNITSLPSEFSLKATNSLVSETFSTSSPAAKDLLTLLDIRCRNCSLSLLNGTSSVCSFSRIIDLPSEHWHELLDCWVCHKEKYITVEQSGHQGGSFNANVDELLVGSNFLLINPNNTTGIVGYEQISVDQSQ
ncbi:hypothetical protein HK096_002596, partial [Nowakowskiella sp. JEL0078]